LWYSFVSVRIRSDYGKIVCRRLVPKWNGMVWYGMVWTRETERAILEWVWHMMCTSVLFLFPTHFVTFWTENLENYWIFFRPFF
jgi:hypothetical protein